MDHERLKRLAMLSIGASRTRVMHIDTGVGLSKILGGQTKILGGRKVVKSVNCMGVSQLLGARARAAPQSLRLGMLTSSLIALDMKFRR